MKSNKGFTLIEIAVVLAIIAILAAIMTPIVTSYIDQARITRANADVKKIAEAILLFKRDTGIFPAGVTPDHDCLISGGASPATQQTVGAGWTCNTTGGLSQVLNVNSMGLASSNETIAIGGITNYRGPYLDGLNGLDPWAKPYIVNSSNLTTTSANWAYAASGGPNGTLDTAQNSPRTVPFAPLGDDIVALIH